LTGQAITLSDKENMDQKKKKGDWFTGKKRRIKL